MREVSEPRGARDVPQQVRRRPTWLRREPKVRRDLGIDLQPIPASLALGQVSREEPEGARRNVLWVERKGVRRKRLIDVVSV